MWGVAQSETVIDKLIVTLVYNITSLSKPAYPGIRRVLGAALTRREFMHWRYDHYRVVQKTDTKFYFWDNFGNAAPILTIVSLLQAEIYGA